MQEDALISQRLVYDHLLQSEKEVWESLLLQNYEKVVSLHIRKKG